MGHTAVEEQLQIRSPKASLYGHLFQSESGTRSADFFLLCPPFFEEKRTSHRLLVELARSLNERGAHALLFDFGGTGDSSGEINEFTIADWLNDLEAAHAFIKNRFDPDRIVLVGIRLSAALSILAAADLAGGDGLVLLEPVLTGQAYLDEMFSRKLVREMLTFSGPARVAETPAAQLERGQTLDWDGFPITRNLYAGIAGLELKEKLLPPKIIGLLIQISPNRKLAPSPARFAAVNAASVRTACLAMPPFWSQIGPMENGPVSAAILDWWQGLGRGPAPAARPRSEPDPAPLATMTVAAPDHRPVCFEVRRQKLYGLLHEPDRPGKMGIIFLHGWGSYRLGPHRLFVQAATRFTALGFTCLRFDFRGRGESEGETGKTTLPDMIDDAAAATAFLQKETTVEKIILLGLCSGGEVAVGTAAANPAVAGLILWSAPLLGAGPDLVAAARQTGRRVGDYWRKLFLPRTWRKVVGARVNYRLVFKVLFGHLAGPPTKTGQETELLEKFKSHRAKMLFVYGGNDSETVGARQAYQTIAAANRLDASFHVIREANHNFYSLNWKTELLELTENWLKQAFPAACQKTPSSAEKPVPFQGGYDEPPPPD